jgi:curved DNA-binding protein
MAKSLYEILEVSVTATQFQIKRAYLKLAKICHPDKNKEEGAAEKFKTIKAAYDTLSNGLQRRAYDLERSSTRGKSETYE